MTQVMPPITSLDPQQRNKLERILVDAFKGDDLRRFAINNLAFHDIQIADEVTFGVLSPSTSVYNLVEKILEYGHLAELLLAVGRVRPAREDVKALLECFGLVVPAQVGPDTVIIPTAIRKAVATFSDGFQKNCQLFKYLEASKQLHNVLHELKGSHVTIAAAVAERKANPSQPLADEVATFLEDVVKVADKYVKDIEFPENPPPWIAKLATAVEVIKGSNVVNMPRQVERLKTLFLENLGPLNANLLVYAKRLKPEELIRSLDEILAVLGSDGNPATASLRREIEEFRSLCAELDRLIRAHNLCQEIDDAFHEAAGLPSVTPEELLGWRVAKDSLDELALQRKTDRKVQRTLTAAKLFEAANQGQEFQTLSDMFDDLFISTDSALLDVIHKLPVKVMALRAALELFQ